MDAPDDANAVSVGDNATFMKIVSQSVVLDSLMQAGDKPGRVAQLQVEINKNMTNFVQNQQEEKLSDRLGRMQTDAFKMSFLLKSMNCDFTTLLQKVTALSEKINQISSRLDTLEKRVTIISAKRSPRDESEPPKRPTTMTMINPPPSSPLMAAQHRTQRHNFTVTDGKSVHHVVAPKQIEETKKS
jgi:hypothetical protein